MTYYTTVESPIGKLLLRANDDALLGIDFEGHYAGIEADWRKCSNHPVLRKAASQLDEYFAGKRRAFDLPLAPKGTPFQRRVWKTLEGIPYARTQSYGEIARTVGSPKAVRAVGAANGANPIPIIVPCHRVIGANGTLTGYGGGLWRKEKLLALEQANSAR
jgi:methylated-DNA-[protein]-cysteine S-methyltransferase